MSHTAQITSIPKGSWVLITGLTGYIASHIGKQLLERGFKVRGTVRDTAKASWLTDDLFATYARAGSLELVQVPDLGAPNAFDEAVKGMSAIVHVATLSSFDPDPNNVIPPLVAGMLSILRAAASEPTIKRFVYTSSVITATMLAPGVSGVVDRNSWNNAALSMAWDAKPPYNPAQGLITYSAGKVEAEKAVWRFVEEEKPNFVLNVVSPTTVFGEMLHSTHMRGTSEWVLQISRGDTSITNVLPTTLYINVKDVALLHVAAVLDPDVTEERLQTWGTPFNWNDVLAILRRLYPEKRFIDDVPNLGEITATTDLSLQKHLLKKWGGQDEFVNLEDGVREAIESIP